MFFSQLLQKKHNIPSCDHNVVLSSHSLDIGQWVSGSAFSEEVHVALDSISS